MLMRQHIFQIIKVLSVTLRQSNLSLGYLTWTAHDMVLDHNLEAISILLHSCSVELGKLQYLPFPSHNWVVNWVFTAVGHSVHLNRTLILVLCSSK